MCKAGSVVPEPRQDPGAEHNAKSRLTAVDLSVRVPFKTRGQFRFQLGDLDGELAEDADRRRRRFAIGLRDERRRRQLRRPQLRLNLGGFLLQVALTASPSQEGNDL